MKIFNFTDSGVKIYTHVTTSEQIYLPTEISRNEVTFRGQKFIPSRGNGDTRNVEIHILQSGQNYIFKTKSIDPPNVSIFLVIFLTTISFHLLIKLIQKIKSC